jgi:hypothetical protein
MKEPPHMESAREHTEEAVVDSRQRVLLRLGKSGGMSKTAFGKRPACYEMQHRALKLDFLGGFEMDGTCSMYR